VSDDLDLLPYSVRRRRPELDQRLPQDRTIEEDINAIADAAARGSSQPVVNLGFARLKGRRA
jgi:hypothetical protein